MIPPPSSTRKEFTEPVVARSLDSPMASEQMNQTDTDRIAKVIKETPTVFEEYKKSKGTGLIIADISLGKGKKTVFSWLWAYFNSAFKDSMGPLTREIISTGQLPEIEQVACIDTEETVKRDMDHGYLGEMMKPYTDKFKVHIESTPLLRSRERQKGGEIIKLVKEYDADKMRENFEAAIWAAAERYKGNTLLIVDSMSDYRDMITDEQDEMAGKTLITKYGKKSGEEDDENTGTDRRFYRYRNKWWTNVLMKLRASSCWIVQTFKLEIREAEWQWKDVKVRTKADKSAKDAYTTYSIKLPENYPVMVAKTDYRIDQGYTLRELYDPKTDTMKNYIRTDWYRHPHSTTQYLKLPQDQREMLEHKCLMEYPQYDRMAATYLIEDMAPAILQRSGKTTWGRYVDGKK